MTLRPCAAYAPPRSSLHIIAESIYSYISRVIDHRLDTDHRWYIKDVRAHVCDHECLCARACVCARMSPSVNRYERVPGISIYTAPIDGYARACGCIGSMHTWMAWRVLTMRPLTSCVRVSMSARISRLRTGHSSYTHTHTHTRVCSRARADGMAVHCMRASATLSLSKAIDGIHTYMVFLFMIDTYISTSTRLEECINDACVLHKRAHVCVRLCARARVRDCLGARASAPTVRALFTSAWTACGSTRRRSPRRMRSTRTSARGTPRQSPRCGR